MRSRLETSLLGVWVLNLLICGLVLHQVAGQPAVTSYLQGQAAATISRSTAPRQLWPIRNVTCCYDLDTGFITGIRYSRFSSQADVLTDVTGRCSSNSSATSTIRLPTAADIYITGVDATYTDLSLLSVSFRLSNNRNRTCDISKAVVTPTARASRIRQRHASAAGLMPAAAATADVDLEIRRTASRLGLAQASGLYVGPIKFYSADTPARLSVKRRFYEGPALYGRKTGLSSLKGICDPRTRHLRNFDREPIGNKGNGCFYWVPCPVKCHYWPNCIPCSPGDPNPSCCCYTSYPIQNPIRRSPSPQPPRPSPSNPWPHNPWPDPIDQSLSPSPIIRRSPSPSLSPSPSPLPPSPLPPSPSPLPPISSPSPSPSPRPGRSPRPRRSPAPGESPAPMLPVPFTVGFAARGQHGCINPVTESFKARVRSYAFEKLTTAGFAADYGLSFNNCTCMVDAAQWNTPIYNCNLELTIADPLLGDPEIIAEYLATDIDISGPWACIDERQGWCAEADEYPTSACGTYPANSSYNCQIEQPPDPLPIPIMFVDEGRNCDAAVQFSVDQQKALIAATFKFTQGLGLVLTYENFTCDNEVGSAFYQATLLLAAGVDVDIYTGSENIVNGVNAQPAICQKDPKAPYCTATPFAGALTCSVNQYDPNQPYICPTAAGNLAVTVGLANCSCDANPDSGVYQRNLATWMATTAASNAVNVGVTVPEGKCVQSGTACQYQYRVRAQPLDEFQDSLSAIQTLATDIQNNPQPCWPTENSGGWPFCTYWSQATVCARSPWNRDQPLTCTILPTN